MKTKQGDLRKRIIRVAFLILMDTLVINLSSILALLLCENLSVQSLLTESYMNTTDFFHYSVLTTAVTILVFVPFKLYNSL